MASSASEDLPRVDINKPKWDQGTYWGRAKYFLTTTNPLNLLCTSKQLDEAKDIVLKYRNGEPLPPDTSLDDVYAAKHIMDSAFHPDTGEKMMLLGRMSAQVPSNMLIVGAMMTYYKSISAVIFWQWINQSFNALVNYTNRSGADPMPVDQIVKSYCVATTGAVGTAVAFNRLTQKAPPIVARWVPFIAVAAANCINVSFMRMKELKDGILITDSDGNELGRSVKAAQSAITSVVISRILMVAPGMIFTPLIMHELEKKRIVQKYPMANTPLQILLCGVFLTFGTPLCCALFPQKVPVNLNNLEPHIKENAEKIHPGIEVGFYNKGL